MDGPSSRLVAALLTRNPGSSIVSSAPGAVRVALALGRRAVTVLVLDAGPGLEGRVEEAAASAVAGKPLHIVVVNPDGEEVAPAIRSCVPPVALQTLALGGWVWAPGQPPLRVCGRRLPELAPAARLATSDALPSLDSVRAAVEREAEQTAAFRVVLMRRRPVVTWAIAALCVVVFGLQMFWGRGRAALAAGRMGAEIPDLVFEGQLWRMLSAILLHANVVHLAMNMLALFGFGLFLERLVGGSRYFLLFALSGLGGSLLSLTRGGAGIGLGASGGIWGLMVAGAVVATWPRGLLPVSLASSMRRRAWSPVVINLLYSLQPGIDVRAHVGGGLAGAALALLLTRQRSDHEPLRPMRSLRLAAAAAAGLLALCLGVALREGRPWRLFGEWTLVPVDLEGTSLRISAPGRLSFAPGSGEWRTWRWGRLDADGAGLAVLVSERHRTLRPEQALDDALRQLEKPSDGMYYSVKPMRLALPSGRKVVFCEEIPSDGQDARRFWRWLTTEDDRLVVIFEATFRDAPAARQDQLRKIVDSLTVSR